MNTNEAAVLARVGLGRLTLAVTLVTTLVALALGLGIKAVVGVCGFVTNVGVDANELAAILRDDAFHVDGTSAVACAVAARAVDLAIVFDVEVLDVDVAAAVVLNDLVRGMESAAADNVDIAVALGADGVLADVLKPDVFQVASTKTVDTLGLILTDDNVAESCTFLEDENSILLTALSLASAGTGATIVLRGISAVFSSIDRRVEYRHTLTHSALKVSPFLMYLGSLSVSVPVCSGRPPS